MSDIDALSVGTWTWGMVWQPIETAPKSGDLVWVMSPEWLLPIPAHFISREHLRLEHGSHSLIEGGWYPSHMELAELPGARLFPTHWRPVENPPSRR